jgi:F-type H+-transporting ATPase subunit b
VSITGTLIIQIIVFLLVAFTMKFVWPPIAKALDERAQKIAEGLAADKAKSELADANQRVEQQLAQARAENAQRLADAERRAQAIIEEAKARANDEGAKIIAAARAEAQQQAVQAREALRERWPSWPCGRRADPAQGSQPAVHADLLNRLKTELCARTHPHG